MASLRQDPRNKSPFWYACVTLPNGKQTQLSTKLRVDEVRQTQAQVYADALEKAYRVKRSEAQFRRHMIEAWKTVNGSELASSTTGKFLERWIGRKKREVDPSTLTRYAGIVRDFVAFLGERSAEDISMLSSADIVRFRDFQAEKMSAVSANLSVKVLRTAFKSAMRERLVTENPAGVEFVDPVKRKGENRRRRAFSLPELSGSCVRQKAASGRA